MNEEVVKPYLDIECYIFQYCFEIDGSIIVKFFMKVQLISHRIRTNPNPIISVCLCVACQPSTGYSPTWLHHGH